jgi:hypothetical protein
MRDAARRRGWRGRLALAAGLAAVLAGCGAGAGVAGSVAHLLLPSGDLNAAIHVFVSPTKPYFRGYLAGHALNGVYSPGDKTLAAQLCPGTPVSGPDAVVFTYSGTYDGQAYSFSGCLAYPTSATGGGAAFRIRGHIGAAAISGSTTFPLDEHPGAPGVYTFPFSGTIGSQALTGSALVQAPSSGGIMLVARLTVRSG